MLLSPKLPYKMSAPRYPELPAFVPPLLPGPGETAVPPLRGPWGFWPTAGWGTIIGCAYLGVQILVTIVSVIAYGVLHHGQSLRSAGAAIAVNGSVVSMAAILTVPVVVGLCLLFARLRNGPKLGDYLGLRWPTAGAFVGWCLALVVLIVASDCLSVALGRPLVPEVMAEIYRNTAFKPSIWVAMVLAAPLAEEFFFRGFLFQGWSQSPLGGPGTVWLTAALWAMMHLQYDAYGMATVFIGGLLVGSARLKSGSMLLCVVMHAMMNLVATLEMVIFLAAD